MNIGCEKFAKKVGHFGFMYFTIVSAPGHFCIAALYKSSMYCIVLYQHPRIVQILFGKLSGQ